MSVGDQPRELLSQILRDADDGERALDRLAPVVYSELKNIARGFMHKEASGQTLQPTALVHEAYVRLVDESAIGERGRSYFFGTAARAMRQILIERARGRQSQKRGGDRDRVSLAPGLAVIESTEIDVIALDDALKELCQLDARQAQVVELRFFGGLSVQEVAAYLGVSERTIKTDWQVARAWLRRKLDDGEQESR